MKEPIVIVYALLAEGDPRFRYIGVTKRSVQRRLKEHFAEARQGVDTYKCRWLRKCLRENKAVKAVEISRVPESAWPLWEQFFIATTPGLTNSQAGGIGAVGISEEARAKMSARKKGKSQNLTPEQRKRRGDISRGRVWTAESKAKLSKSRKGQKLSAKHRAKISALQTGRPGNPKAIESMAAANRGKPLPIETRLKVSLAQKGKTLSPEHIANLTAARRKRALRELGES